MSAFFAFLHHVAAFTLVAAVAVEFVLLRGELTVQRARQIRFAELALGIAAGIVFVVGMLRVSRCSRSIRGSSSSPGTRR